MVGSVILGSSEGPEANGQDRPAVTGPVGPRLLAGGMVAYNDERRIGAALHSLLSQRLPDGWRWGTVHVVASGCTDRTVDVVEQLATNDPRIQLIVEPERTGKARALREVILRSTGDAVVLLNSDARALPGAVAELLGVADALEPPFAVMGCPRPSPGPTGAVARILQLLWHLHDEFHRETLSHGDGTHLSDELLLLSLTGAPSIPDGIINDGSFIGAWLAGHEGALGYASGAEVDTEVPSSLRDHLSQRRRILVGHRQVERLLGIAPSVLPRFACRHPLRAFAVVRRALARGRHSWADLFLLTMLEQFAAVLAGTDLLLGRTDYRRWRRISDRSSGPSRRTALDPPVTPASSTTPAVGVRLGALLEVARRLGVGIPLSELAALLPPEGPADEQALRRWFEGRPEVGRVVGTRAFGPEGPSQGLDARTARARRYRRAARELVTRDLSPILPLVRCAGITGSTAYGTPKKGDDLDLLVVTRPGSVWLFLAFAYLAVRLRGSTAGERPPPCLNYVVDEEVARAEFSRSRGFLFAREALTVQPLVGDRFYRDLLASGPWMGVEVPRLYSARAERSGTPVAPDPAPWALRALNAGLFPVLATYVQLAGLYRNRRERDAGGGGFRTVTLPRRLAFFSVRFDELGSELDAASVLGASAGPMSAPSRIPSAR